MVKKQKLKKAFTKHVDHLKKVKKPPTNAKAPQPGKSPKGNAARKITPRIQFPYTESDVILLVGEGTKPDTRLDPVYQCIDLLPPGNFSFAHALSEKLHGAATIIATAYDSEETAREKYPDIDDHLSAITELGGETLFEVDATTLHKNKRLKNKKFTKIVFNFPHVGAGIKDQDRNILTNQSLLLSFLSTSHILLTSPTDPLPSKSHTPPPPGQIHITVKEGEPYDSWNIRAQAKATDVLICSTSFQFIPSLYPGYEHRRTIGFADGVSKGDNEDINKRSCRTYVFVRKEDGEVGEEKKKRKKDDSDSEDN
ncbi:hypothetical protein HK097_011418 [Rhizophlyctis rosea]|uniref:25S rRNA (uridine-N(3))-methyltransferase BMT5-like domain-containing protein n=1 Tax=Rhizophlyctis rosea TaxID=64517 RepID=A0AAD5S6D1_9FUNG|nr:hypothetical protein HK097_011418 [Rhizophlyctis rosea]